MFNALVVPVPTSRQLDWMKNEIMLLVHFNMGTYTHNGDPSCDPGNWNMKADYAEGKSSDPALFDPEKLDVKNWIQTMKDIDAKHAVLTAKHGCGFLLWPTLTTFSDGSNYGYHVGNTKDGRDVVGEFSKEMAAAGLGYGFYYSLPRNYFLNVDAMEVQDDSTWLSNMANVTQEEFENIAMDQLGELWGNYGKFTEIWFDGGYSDSLKEKVQGLLEEKQPDAVTFGGFGIGKHPACWVGTETGLADSEGLWIAGTEDLGDFKSGDSCPKACDTTLQNDDTWFFEADEGIRNLEDLKEVYHKTVGNNGLLEMDLAINRDGIVEPSHAKRYKELGDWIRSCYGEERNSFVDRVKLREDMSEHGQNVLSFNVEASVEGGGWFVVYEGDEVGIGNKKIVFLDQPLENVTALRVKVTKLVGGKKHGEIEVLGHGGKGCE